MCLRILEYILLVFVIHFVFSKSERPIVHTTYGRILGNVLTTNNGNQYYSFQEIPFASPPEGKLRFKQPVAPEEWDGVLHTTENTKICHQIARTDTPPGVTETEDCLYLNVYTPKDPNDNSTDPLSVLVWIYGGGFKNGDATFQTYGPKYFMDYDIIVVTMNYRVGPFGFLTTEDGVIPANLALKDQNFALQWVQSNIKFFGGDPSKVTIAGESAGGASVGYHLLNKNSEGLFRGAILQSGTAIGSYAHQRWAKYYAFQCAYALSLGFTTQNSTELLELLQSVPAESLNNARLTVPVDKENGIGSHRKIIWAPVIENESLDDTFIIGPMHDNIKNGNVVNVPILLGFNSEEELAFINYDIVTESRKYDNNLELLIHNKFDMSEKDKKLAGEQFRQIYTDGNFEDVYGSLVQFLSDEAYTTPAARQAELQSNYGDVYLYQFSHKGILGGINIFIEGTETVAHSEDLHYLWDLENYHFNASSLPISDILTRNRLLRMWTNFVKYLNPTPESDPLLANVIWPKVSPGNALIHPITYLNINTTLAVGTDPKHYQEIKKIVDKYVIEPLSNY